MTRRTTATRAVLAVMLLVLAFAGVGLGVWQVQRRAWKHDLIAAVEGRSTAANRQQRPGPTNGHVFPPSATPIAA